MSQNDKLENEVLKMMSRYITTIDSRFAFMTEGSDEIGVAIIETQMKQDVDLSCKQRIRFHNHVCYGYDFQCEQEGVSVKDTYLAAVKATKEVSGKYVEKFIKEEIINDRFGLYITKL